MKKSNWNLRMRTRWRKRKKIKKTDLKGLYTGPFLMEWRGKSPIVEGIRPIIYTDRSTICLLEILKDAYRSGSS